MVAAAVKLPVIGSLVVPVRGVQRIAVGVVGGELVTLRAIGVSVKVAVTLRASVISTVQVLVPVQSPLQPLNVESAAGVAVRVMVVRLVIVAVQVVPQLMLAGVEVTVPFPVLVIVKTEGGGVAVTACTIPSGLLIPTLTGPLPLSRVQVMVVVPSGPVATCGLDASWPVVERSIGVLKVVAFAARVAACTMVLLPLERRQVMVVVPSGPVSTCGLSALAPMAERSIGVLKVVAFAARVAACTMSSLLLLGRLQVMVVVPSGPVSTCGLSAFPPVVERSIGVLKVVAFAARVAAWTMKLLPLYRLQLMVVVPSGPVATCGLSALWPVVEMSIGVLKVVAPAARVAACTM